MAILLSACGANDDKSSTTLVNETPVSNEVAEETQTSTGDAPTQSVPADVPVNDVKSIDLANKVPGQLKISTDGSSVSLSWSPIRGAQSYNVYYNEADYVGTGDTMFTTKTNSFTHQNLDQTAHSYKVQAVYATSLSDLSQPMFTNLSNYSAAVEDSSSK